MQRRTLLLRAAPMLGLASATAWPWAVSAAPAAAPTIEVWKDPNCGCCEDWVKHLEAHGFTTRVHADGNAAVRARLGVPERMGGCHTGVVGGYAVEGHVPAREIQRLLREKPKAVGLAVPGMPIGSPGMDGPAYGGRRDPYDVLLVQADGRASVFQRYR